MSDRALRAGFVLAVAATFIAGVLYVVAQQAIRHAADHPQVEMARAAAGKLNGGADPASVVPDRQVDIARSSETYLIVVDPGGLVIASSANLDSSSVVPPSGVFDYVRSHGEHVVSWEPAPGVRSAIVVDAFTGGFVVAGRSLAGTESSQRSLILWAALGWAVTMVAIGAAVMIRFRVR